MNRLTPAPPPGTPARFPSGWRARLGRDPVPILLREGSEALVARVRRDLIDDEEAPRAAEVLTYAEVKTFLRKAAARTIEGLHRTVRSFIRTLDPSECMNFFKHAGYDP